MVRLKLVLGLLSFECSGRSYCSGCYRLNAQAGVIAQAVILLVVKAEVIAWDISHQSVKAAIAT